jgi:hypothetical protein
MQTHQQLFQQKCQCSKHLFDSCISYKVQAIGQPIVVLGHVSTLLEVPDVRSIVQVAAGVDDAMPVVLQMPGK